MDDTSYPEWAPDPEDIHTTVSKEELEVSPANPWGSFKQNVMEASIINPNPFKHLPTEWGLDFETYSAADIFEVGIDRYFRDPTTVVLMAGMYADNNDPWGAAHDAIYDFVTRPDDKAEFHRLMAHVQMLDAHNAMFEYLCLHLMGLPVPQKTLVDTAVLARAAGAASALEAAAPQLLGIDKEEMGKIYIQIFSRPHYKPEKIGGLMIPAYQTPENPYFNPQIIRDFPKEWEKFQEYCRLDAKLGFQIKRKAEPHVLAKEQAYDQVTREMNRIGWPVDMTSVDRFTARYEENLAAIEKQFREDANAPTLNLNSLPQLKAWCKDRGINARSFDEKSVERMLKAIDKKLNNPVNLTRTKLDGYEEVHHMLWTKQQLGGSSLKKLKPIHELTASDSRLRDSYMHAGAGATMRTTGKGVQMQNLKRLNGQLLKMDAPHIANAGNEELASNMRQLFRSSDPAGFLIVGDFSSVESRGLAWLAGANWKLDAYRQGKDMYKVLASSPEMFGVPYDEVTKDQRQSGKVGELGCGYQAGPDAIESFAAGMGIVGINAAELVRGWRAINPEIVQFWSVLDNMLRYSYANGVKTSAKIGPAGQWTVELDPFVPPISLVNQHEKKKGLSPIVSMELTVKDSTGAYFLKRVIHGIYEYGRGFRFYKPTSRKTGDLWTDQFTNPKTKQVQHYTIYGGKMAGLLTQSFCREIFMASMRDVWIWTNTLDNVDLIGQFHDELVLDWRPGFFDRDKTMQALRSSMTVTSVPDFPLDADIKYDYRYTK